jgi:hypothetical protein
MIATKSATETAEINELIHGEFPHQVLTIDTSGQTLRDVSAGAVAFHGNAHRSTWIGWDLRGANIRNVSGPLRLISCRVHKLEYDPTQVELIDCDDMLFPNSSSEDRR